MTRRGSVGSLDSGMSISFVQSGATPTTGSAQSHRHSDDGPVTHNAAHHHQTHSVSRVVNNGGNAMHPVVGTCNNCMNPVPLSMGASNHASTCYHHMHHHHYHHHHNLHLQQEYQRHHNNLAGRTTDVQSSNVGNNGNHSGSTVASITSALL